MNEELSFQQIVEKILTYDSRYRADAYAFVNDAVAYTVRKLAESRSGLSRHVRGEELVRGTAELARAEFGPLAWTVLSDWGMTTGPAIGDIVYHLIHEKVLSASSEDSKEDFNCIGDLRILFPEEDTDGRVNLSGRTID